MGSSNMNRSGKQRREIGNTRKVEDNSGIAKLEKLQEGIQEQEGVINWSKYCEVMKLNEN